MTLFDPHGDLTKLAAATTILKEGAALVCSRSLVISVLFVVTASTTEAQNAADTILRLDSAWARSYAVHDTALARALFADDLVVTGTNGSTTNRERELADVRPAAAGLKMEYSRTRDPLVRVYQGAAVVTGVAEWRFDYNGRTSEYRQSYTSVFARGGPLGWRMVALHIGRAPDK